MSTIIIEIPHQLPPIAWIADSDQEIINIADSKHGLIYERWTFTKAVDCWGEEDDIPKELAQTLKEHGEAIEIGDLVDSEYYSPNEAQSELEAAKEAIRYDLSSCQFLTFDEAKEFVVSYCGHQEIKARIAVKKALIKHTH